MKAKNWISSKALTVAAATLLIASAANAGEFNTWSYTHKAKSHDVVVSFASDGAEQEAQIDLDVPAGLKFRSAQALVAGAVCVGLENGAYVRAVPPSGAGKALPTAETDYCKFSFEKVSAVKGGASVELSQRFVECSEPGGPIKSCGLKSFNVSEKAALQ